MNPTPVPDAWLASPPNCMVVGDGAYARALTQVLGAELLGTEQILTGPAPNEAGGFPRVLGDLERVFLVASSSHSAADLLRIHNAVWDWMEKLSPDGDQHELSILFVLPPTGGELGKALAAGLGLESFESDVPGHGLARMDDSLTDLLVKAVAIVSQDLPPLRARQAADVRRVALGTLRQATTGEDLVAAAERVVEAFRGQEYLLDLFCRPPSHRHGNLLRAWLNKIVTGPVTQENCNDVESKLAEWLANP